MTKLLEGGVEITALHNHLLRADPPTYYMHVGGHGDPVKIAAAIRAALALSKTPFQASPPPAPSVDLPTAQLDEIMAAKGQANGGVYQFVGSTSEGISVQAIQISTIMHHSSPGPASHA